MSDSPKAATATIRIDLTERGFPAGDFVEIQDPRWWTPARHREQQRKLRELGDLPSKPAESYTDEDYTKMYESNQRFIRSIVTSWHITNVLTGDVFTNPQTDSYEQLPFGAISVVVEETAVQLNKVSPKV